MPSVEVIAKLPSGQLSTQLTILRVESAYKFLNNEAAQTVQLLAVPEHDKQLELQTVQLKVLSAFELSFW